jgi:hypothetical protein
MANSRRIREIWCVKFPLTEGQDLRLLCIGGRCNLFTVQSIQSTENAYEINQSHRAICAGAPGRYGYGCFGTRFSVVGRSLIGRIAESRTFRQVSDSAYLTLLPGAAAAAATRRIKRRVDGSSARPPNSLCNRQQLFDLRLVRWVTTENRTQAVPRTLVKAAAPSAPAVAGLVTQFGRSLAHRHDRLPPANALRCALESPFRRPRQSRYRSAGRIRPPQRRRR